MTTNLDDISEAIGRLRAEVQNLSQQMAHSNKRADNHRSAIHRRVDDLVRDVGDLSSSLVGVKHDVAVVREDLGDAKKVTDEVKQWKQRGIGALFVTGIASASLSGMIVGFAVYWWDAFMKLLRS
ncbi:uncharacterized protein YoxC [Aminobacter niigataensis]|uniref:Uncharacterized protein YoxC n=1 Tax=Aminobacter niigataensis TaxID=83265 RepID=A0ABR6L8A5_9HYPH|nr:DUF1515 family protein [Aminobacter niigataensis]MBB4653034.1 uncharacterized protein YoxC [Aminobacter niigataensis]